MRNSARTSGTHRRWLRWWQKRQLNFTDGSAPGRRSTASGVVEDAYQGKFGALVGRVFASVDAGRFPVWLRPRPGYLASSFPRKRPESRLNISNDDWRLVSTMELAPSESRVECIKGECAGNIAEPHRSAHLCYNDRTAM